MPILLSMNDTTILFVHSDATKHRNPSAVQVTVKTERSPDVWNLAAYYCVQHEISELITRLIAAHAHKELKLPLIFEGRNYTLTASRKPWNYHGRLLTERINPYHGPVTASFRVASRHGTTDRPEA
ncbi:hypothetical protein ABKN59_005169 [Abortiporus biennis]